HLLGKLDRVAARLGPKGLTTAAPLRHRLVAVTGLAGALLLVHFLASDVHFRTVLGVVGSGHALQELIAHHAVDEIGPRLKAEDRIRELDGAGLGGLERGDVSFHHAVSFDSVDCGASEEPLRGLKAPGRGASFGGFFKTASRTSTQPPLEPGTAPRTITRPRAGSVFTTTRFCVVTRSAPMWPAIFLPLNTLP